MHITKSNLKQIIQEEYSQLLKEQWFAKPLGAMYAKLKPKKGEIRQANLEYTEDELHHIAGPTDAGDDIWDPLAPPERTVFPSGHRAHWPTTRTIPTSQDLDTSLRPRPYEESEFEDIPIDVLHHMADPAAQEAAAIRQARWDRRAAESEADTAALEAAAERRRAEDRQADIDHAKSIGVDPVPIDPKTGLDFKLKFAVRCSGGGPVPESGRCAEGELVEPIWKLPSYVKKIKDKYSGKWYLYNEKTGRILKMPKGI